MEQEHRSLLRRTARELANPLGLAEADILIERGSASEVLCNEAEARKASVLVLGSVARTGLNAFLLGNTAEQVVDNVACGVLALKPEGHLSPLALQS